LMTVARAKGYNSLRITTGAQNEAMRALASKFGAQLVFRHGESTGTIDLTKQDQTELATSWADNTFNAARTVANLNRAYWQMLLRMSGWSRAA
jgi:Zn-dependent alcohol dehydrogenase